MPNSGDEKHSPSEFYYPGETNYTNATFQGENNAEQLKQQQKQESQEKVFSGFFYKVRKNCNSTRPYNKSLINLVCSVCTGMYCLRFLTKTSGNTFPYRPRTRLISPYSKL